MLGTTKKESDGGREARKDGVKKKKLRLRRIFQEGENLNVSF